jgi:peptidoglycan L-alanyl-D-glutamate endopeptidase CwlK
MTSRSIDDLVPELRALYWKFSAAMAQAGLTFMVTSTYRDQAEQDALYAQGRTKPGKVVTWVKRSKHQERKAFDIALLKDGKPVWDTKVSVNGNDIPDYLEAARIGESIGLRAGGLWKKPDYPHFELREIT